MSEGKPFKSPLPMIYAAMLNGAREMAAHHGYALAIHGSMSKDFDIIAIPWTETCSQPNILIAALSFTLHHLVDGVAVGPEFKPHGRLAYAIPMGNGAVLDVSVIPPNAQITRPAGDAQPPQRIDSGSGASPCSTDSHSAGATQ